MKIRFKWFLIYICIPVFVTALITSLKSYGQELNSNNVHKYFELPKNITSKDYLDNTIIIRIKGEYRNICSENKINDPDFNKIAKILEVTSLSKKFPNQLPPLQNKSINTGKPVDLSLIYELKYNKGLSIEQAINMILPNNIIQYAEPHYIYKPLYQANDPQIPSQWSLSVTKAFNAWNIAKGDTNVVIGIVDSGTLIDHPDLVNNIKYNYNDPLDGVDNDNDGFTDNFRGWNLADNNNDVSCGNYLHGAWVSGIAAASTDNGTGIASPGFNCKFLPVKVTNSNGLYTMAIEGIVYAADHGCNIINCSWGASGAYSKFGQDVVNYATFNKNSLIVAAAGNDGNSTAYYPASFDNVISVGATNSSDLKYNYSNYGSNIDLMAPGVNLTTTDQNGTYDQPSNGTSFSAAFVSGCAALVKSRFPNYTALQIGEKLRVTTDHIDSLNQMYQHLMGSGRVNLYNAVSDTAKPSLRMTEINITDKNDGIFTKGDTLYISGLFTNFLHPTLSANVVATCSSYYVTVINPLFYLDNIPTLGTKSNTSAPFKLVFSPNMPNNYTVVLTLTFTDNNSGYTGQQYIEININPAFLDVTTKALDLTIGNNSRIGYYDIVNRQGNGLIFKNDKSLLYYGGFMIGNSQTTVEDNLKGTANNYQNDFIPVGNISRTYSDLTKKCEVKGIFNDNNTIGNKLNLNVNYSATAFNTPTDSNYVILKYTVINQRATTLQNLYAGLFADIDIDESTTDRTEFDSDNNMLYTYSLLGGPYVGLQLISKHKPYYYAFDLDGTNGSINVNSGFSGLDKFNSLKSQKPTAGMAATGNDVASLISDGPYDLNPNDSLTLTFALIAGDYLGDLKKTATKILSNYLPSDTTIGINRSETNVKNNIIYPMPAKDYAIIEYSMPSNGTIDITVFDITGKIIYENSESQVKAGINRLMLNTSAYKNGFYYCRLSTTNNNIFNKNLYTFKLIVLK